MNKIIIAASLLISFSPIAAQAGHDDGLITKKSQYSVSKTLDRLENVLKKKGITVALRWKHDAKAKGVNVDLRPTELLIFGNPKIGSHMFTSNQTAGIDLPLKALAWQDENGDVFLSYNDPAYVAKRHHINDRAQILKKMSGALNKLSNVATGNN
ncbi:MAG: DUF302 domain-containing protein [Gammaproteobacteria bacterium]|nr:DUF302 domain-containing protein [Gammaproteobacteria bacterium]